MATIPAAISISASNGWPRTGPAVRLLNARAIPRAASMLAAAEAEAEAEATRQLAALRDNPGKKYSGVPVSQDVVCPV
jgi:hypothetical protein